MKKLFTTMVIIFLCSFAIPAMAQAEVSHPRVVAHGGGSIDGYATTNSLEAVQLALEQGYTWIELDMALTSDGGIALIHDWYQGSQVYFGTSGNHVMTMDEFMSYKIHQRYTTMNVAKLAEIMANADEQVRIISDTKTDNLLILQKIAQEYPMLAKRIIPQIYHYNELEKVRSYGYQEVILTLYKMNTFDTGTLVKFVKDNGICAVAVNEQRAQQSFVKTLQANGIAVYAHTINNYENGLLWRQNGIYGVYSDTLLPQYFDGIGQDYYLVKYNARGEQKRLDEYSNLDGLNVLMKGKDSQAMVVYSIDGQEVGKGKVNQVLTLATKAVSYGQHQLTAEIFDSNQRSLGTVDYLVWIDQQLSWIADEQFAHVLQQLVPVQPITTVTANQSSRLAEILEQSFIACRGSYVYYQQGKIGIYRNGYGFLKATQNSRNQLLIPFTATGYALGASRIIMNGDLEMEISYQQKNGIASINKPELSFGGTNYPLNTAITLVQNKAMSGTEIFRHIFQRQVIEQNGLMIILPKGVEVTDEQGQQLVRMAGRLYSV